MPNVFKRNILAPVPNGATITERGGERTVRFVGPDGKELRRRIIQTKAGDRIAIGQSLAYYGKVKAGRKWQRVKLFSDKTASTRRLADLQRDQDHRAAGIITPDTERMVLPVRDLATQYIASLRSQNKDADHLRISEWMLTKLIDTCGWQTFRDVTVNSIEKVLPTLGKTASYQNKFIVRAKAFVHWVLPDGWGDPLKKLKRVREKGGKQTRARRHGTDAEIRRLFGIDIPDNRKLAYALAAFNGLRRNEVEKLLGQDLHLDATIPYVGLLQKQGHDNTLDYVPIHPYVLRLLKGRLLMPGAAVLNAVPDMKTMKRDLTRADITMTDPQGERLDYHALRHTFQTNLDRTGCSRATKKKLMRHAKDDVTDGYAHAELQEMLTALSRIVGPDRQPQTAVRTGTHDQTVTASAAIHVVQDQHQGSFLRGHGDAPSGIPNTLVASVVSLGNQRDDDPNMHVLAASGLPSRENRDTVLKTRPSTQVD